MHEITRDKSIWLRFLSVYRLPETRSSRLPDADLDPEQLFVALERIHRLWLLPRTSSPEPLQRPSGKSLIGLQLLLDKWLLAFYSDGFVHLWDLDNEVLDPCATLSLEEGSRSLSSYAAAMDPIYDKILLAFTEDTPSGLTSLYEISLTETPSFHLTRTFEPDDRPTILREIDPMGQCILSSRLCSIEIRHLEDGSLSKIPTETEDMEEIYTNIIGLKLLGPYVLAVKTRTLELHPAGRPGQESHMLPVLKYTLPRVTLRVAQISDSIEFMLSDGSKSISVQCLAYDSRLGLFHFAVKVQLPSEDSDGSPLLDVKLVGLNAMNSRELSSYHVDGSVSPTPSSSHLEAVLENERNLLNFRLSHITGSSHSFVSTMALGSRGMRAIWVARSPSSMVGDLVACDFSNITESAEKPGDLNGKIVHSSHSYDLRKFWNHCAIGEASGHIIVGDRMGDLFVLNI
ncbi:hypothetical protein C8J56DRAFT_470300 [Mycena floridula]|nr:hypothetical protein C8J56DRAFT_470300 [Mycena floridula]